MRLVMHGGKCCGIKTIYGFDDSPDEWTGSVAKKNTTDKDTFGEHVGSNVDFFTDEAPEETFKARLDRLIAFCIKRRPHGIIEATLSDYASYGSSWMDQRTLWQPLLRKRGFKLVTKALNSNTQNNVYVYHKVY